MIMTDIDKLIDEMWNEIAINEYSDEMGFKWAHIQYWDYYEKIEQLIKTVSERQRQGCRDAARKKMDEMLEYTDGCDGLAIEDSILNAPPRRR